MGTKKENLVIDLDYIKYRISKNRGRKITNVQLAKELDVSTQTLSNWSKDIFEPKLSQLLYLAEQAEIKEIDVLVKLKIRK